MSEQLDERTRCPHCGIYIVKFREHLQEVERERNQANARANASEPLLSNQRVEIDRLTRIEQAALGLCQHYINNDEPFAKLRKALGVEKRGTG